jgi:anti-sigma-K factor RskA
MTSPPSALPENWQELMAGYALGDLTSEEAEEVQRLLSEHPYLADEINQFQEVLALLPYSLPDQVPSPQLRYSILATAEVTPRAGLRVVPNVPNSPSAIASATEMPEPSAPTQFTPRRRQNWQQWGGAIAAGLIAVLGWNTFQLQRQTQTLQATLNQLQDKVVRQNDLISALQQPGAASYQMRGTGTASNAAGVLVVAPQKGKVAIVTNLEELPQGEIYRLWAMPKTSKKPVYCGQFSGAATGYVATFESSDGMCNSNQVGQMLITSEQLSDPYEPKGKLVMESQVL